MHQEKRMHSRQLAGGMFRTFVYCMRKWSLHSSEGQCCNSRNIDPAILPPKFSNDWHPGTDHMPFAIARPPSHARIDIRHAACVSHSYCMRSYRVVNTCFIIFHLTGNVFSNLSPISVDTSPFSLRRTKMSMNCCSRQHLRHKGLNQWRERLNIYHAKKPTTRFSWIFQIFTRTAFTLVTRKNRIRWYFPVPNPTAQLLYTRKNLISCIVLSLSVLHRISGGIGNIREQEIPLKICALDIQYHWRLINELR